MKKWKLLCVLAICAALITALSACGGNPPAQESGAGKDEDVPGTASTSEPAPASGGEEKEENEETGDKEDGSGADVPEDGGAAPASEQPPAEAPSEDQPEASGDGGNAGQSAPVSAVNKPEETETASPPAETAAVPAEQEETVPAEESQPVQDPKAVAQGLVGHSVSELYAAIGQPLSSGYAPSCLVEGGEDGELAYNGFVVYTTREGSSETVYAVM